MKRIRPAPMGRAFRYVRRIAHIEIVLAERGRSGEELATVVGEEHTDAKAKTKDPGQRRKRAPSEEWRRARRK